MAQADAEMLAPQYLLDSDALLSTTLSYVYTSHTDLAQADDIAKLHGQIRECDELLFGMEQMLSVFQADLGSISSEIQSLQVHTCAAKRDLTSWSNTSYELLRLAAGIVSCFEA